MVWLHRVYYQKNNKELVINQTTVGNWYKNHQGTSRFIEVGEGISEASDQENYSNVDNPIIETDREEQSTEDEQESQAETATLTTNYITTYGRAS